MCYEIPVTIFKDGTDPDFKTFYARGSFSEVSQAVDNYLSARYPSYDYELVECDEERLKSARPENILSVETVSEEAVVDRDIYDDMEDLQDRYYTLMDKLNAIPATDATKGEDIQKQIGGAQFHLNEAKSYFDQYDFQACKDALDQAEKSISLVQKAKIKKISNEALQQRAIEEIESTPETTLKFGLLSEAIKAENDTVVLYQSYMQQYPDWADVLQDITNEELKHIGQLEDLRNRLSSNIGQKIAEGEVEGKGQIIEQQATEAFGDDFDDDDFYGDDDDYEPSHSYTGDYSERIKYLVIDIQNKGKIRKFIDILEQEFGIDWDTEDEDWAKDVFEKHGGDPGDGICTIADTLFICSKDKSDCWTVDEGDPEETMELLLDEPKMRDFLQSLGLVSGSSTTEAIDGESLEIGGVNLFSGKRSDMNRALLKLIHQNGFMPADDHAKEVLEKFKDKIDPYAETDLVAFMLKGNNNIIAVFSKYGNQIGVYFVNGATGEVVSTPDFEEGYYDGISTSDAQFNKGIQIVKGWN